MSLVFATTFFFLFFFGGGGVGVLRQLVAQTDFEFKISGPLDQNVQICRLIGTNCLKMNEIIINSCIFVVEFPLLCDGNQHVTYHTADTSGRITQQVRKLFIIITE